MYVAVSKNLVEPSNTRVHASARCTEFQVLQLVSEPLETRRVKRGIFVATPC